MSDANAQSCLEFADDMARCEMLHAPIFQPFGQVTGDIARSIVAEQPRLMNNVTLVTARFL
jgi:hypothetical protein